MISISVIIGSTCTYKMYSVDIFFCILILFVSDTFGMQRAHRLPEQDSKKVERYERWFTQTLNHFNPSDTRTWRQRYFVNDQYFNSDGPVFLLVGGEGELLVDFIDDAVNSTWISFGRKFGALCLYLEHRYYGRSRPTEDLGVDNLQYLTSQQALQDLATFISAMNVKYNLQRGTKWIAFGFSYPGTLAAWLRLKYPHLVHGAVSSSSVLIAQVEYPGYIKVVEESIKQYNSHSYSAIMEAFSEIDSLLRTNNGRKMIDEKFKLCYSIEDYFENINDVAGLYRSLMSRFFALQHYKYKINDMEELTFDAACDIMGNSSLGSALNRLAVTNALSLNIANASCLNYRFEDFVKSYNKIDYNNPANAGLAGNRQWYYQTCTEIGLYQTSNAPPFLFGNKLPLKFFIDMCKELFGDKYNLEFITDSVNQQNITYGGMAINITNAVYIHGSLDPWHLAGITETVKDGTPVIFIEGTSHMADMLPEHSDDLPQLKAARQKIQQYVASWLED